MTLPSKVQAGGSPIKSRTAGHPEGVIFVAAEQNSSGAPLVIASNEVSGTVSVTAPDMDAPAEELLDALREQLGVEDIIVTGVHRGREIGYLARLEERTVSIQYPRVERTLHGTGDVFASALCGALLSGAEAPAALERAAEFCNACVEKTAQRQPAHWYGLAFEDVLKERNAL